MRCFFHGNIRISPDFRFRTILERSPQCNQIARLAQSLIHLYTNTERTVFLAAVHHFAEEQTVVLIDSDGSAGWNGLRHHEAQTAAGLVDCPADDGISGRAGEVSNTNVLVGLNPRFPPSFHVELIGEKYRSLRQPLPWKWRGVPESAPTTGGIRRARYLA